jgi:hypothetical protein
MVMDGDTGIVSRPRELPVLKHRVVRRNVQFAISTLASWVIVDIVYHHRSLTPRVVAGTASYPDAEAKKAAADLTLTQLRRHRPLKSARIDTSKQWQGNSGAKFGMMILKKSQSITTYYKNKRMGNKNGPKLYNEIANRNTATTIAQLRTGHNGLNHYLHRFDINEFP